MNKLPAMLLLSLFLFGASCSESEIAVPENPSDQSSPEVEQVREYHEKIRTIPYPIAESTIYVNPAPLIVPQGMKKGETLQFQLSQDPEFVSESTILSEPVEWCMFSPHRILDAGTWYWRFRSDGGDWSEVYSFVISGDEDSFATPSFATFLANCPRRHPRLNCFIDYAAEIYRETAPSHPEYSRLINRAQGALSLPADNTEALYSDYNQLKNSVMWLSDAYVVTADERYAAKLLEILDAITSNPPSDAQLFSENFATSAITYAYTAIYDLLYLRLSPAMREAAEARMFYALNRFYRGNLGYEENHIFDNHFWQHNMRIMFQTAFALFDSPRYADLVLPALQYYYELWCTRAPATGFSRDGLWQNGVGYMSANTLTLFYMPKLLSYITRFDFLTHPWYRAVGRSLCYSCPTGSMGVGFGDNSERYTSTNRQYPALADFIASETGDPYAAWYASENKSILSGDYELRLYRMTRQNSAYDADVPEELPGMVFYPDAGEVAMHSNIENTATDLALAFRSSGFGSGSHTTASQNAFNLYYGGRPVLHSSGYYQNFSDAHNLMSYRHSRAHNTILVNGIGQPYTTRAYGSMVRAGGGRNISYALGDASGAYCGVTDDPMWLNAFDAAGIAQTPQNGFGSTPLTRYRRHVAMLKGGIVLIYDELEAREAAQWDWLLHSDTRFAIDVESLTAEVESAASRTQVTLLSSARPALSQTGDFVVPPAIRDPEYPDQWHFTARFDALDRVRVLAVIQTVEHGDDFKPLRRNADGTLEIAGWTLSAQLDPTEPAALTAVSKRGDAGLSFGPQPLDIGGRTYTHTSANSTLIVDKDGGATRDTELIDTTPANSRSAF